MSNSIIGGPGVALIVVDVQNDFCEGGSLPVAGGIEAAAQIGYLIEGGIENYDLVVLTRDYHQEPHGHFAPEGEEPNYSTTWPVHCRAGEPGSAYRAEITAALNSVSPSQQGKIRHILKGAFSAAYSGFQGANEEGASLNELLEAHNISAVEIVGVAYDHCVKATALDAIENGLTTTIHSHLSPAVSAQGREAASAELTEAGVVLSY